MTYIAEKAYSFKVTNIAYNLVRQTPQRLCLCTSLSVSSLRALRVNIIREKQLYQQETFTKKIKSDKFRILQSAIVPMESKNERPFVLGLTGSIGMGKSAVSAMMRELQIPVLDADQVVHSLYSPGGAAVTLVAEAFPGSLQGGAISRTHLSKYVINNQENMSKLEGIVHPLVQLEREKFLQKAASSAHKLVVLDIPLLFETGAEHTVDAVMVVSTNDAQIQKQRVLSRPGMIEEKFNAILSRQVSDEEKRNRADFVVNTACSLEDTKAAVTSIVETLTSQKSQSLKCS
mmetsp:Transcript_9168/g.12436  ORF Transcript_9168/g.12436 Transcript_9168/m.12436 type:complete len:289 (-) Transcript_9168:83-949(-)